jgi:hypothetical protein
MNERALSIDAFCERYGVGRTLAYAEIKAGRLKARKIGKRTVIPVDASEDWLAGLKDINDKPGS